MTPARPVPLARVHWVLATGPTHPGHPRLILDVRRLDLASHHQFSLTPDDARQLVLDLQIALDELDGGDGR